MIMFGADPQKSIIQVSQEDPGPTHILSVKYLNFFFLAASLYTEQCRSNSNAGWLQLCKPSLKITAMEVQKGDRNADQCDGAQRESGHRLLLMLSAPVMTVSKVG